jgi:hypothetical protein
MLMLERCLGANRQTRSQIFDSRVFLIRAARWKSAAGIAVCVSSPSTETEEDAATEVVATDKCGLCGGDPFKRDISRTPC